MQQALSPRGPTYFHPATWFSCWVAFLFSLAYLSIESLTISCVVFWVVAFFSGARPLQALQRIRWVVISGTVIYAFATPGKPLWPTLGIFSPTINGLGLGMHQMLRLVAAVIGLATIMSRLGSQGVLVAMDWLLRPLCHLGYSPDRLISRLWLTLHYIESARKQSFAQLLSELGGSGRQDLNAIVILQLQPMRWRDYVFFMAAIVFALILSWMSL